MHLNRTPTAILCLLLSSLAGLAWAVTEAELEADATALLSGLEDLEDEIDACTGGACSEAQQIVDRLGALSGRLDDLHAERATLPGCPCTTVDGLLSDLDDLRGDLEVVVGNWEITS